MGHAILAFIAAFAPFLANSHPFLMRRGRPLEKPAAAVPHAGRRRVASGVLDRCDSLFVRWRWSLGKRAAILAGVIAVATLFSIFIAVHPQKAPVYDIYRVGIKDGKITQGTWYPPIHYSPDDHQRDIPDARLNPPSRESISMGTTEDAADLASNMIYASRIAMSIGFVCDTEWRSSSGVIMGGLMGYFAGWVDLDWHAPWWKSSRPFPTITLLLLMAFRVAKFQSSPELSAATS